LRRVGHHVGRLRCIDRIRIGRLVWWIRIEQRFVLEQQQ
jgi:hypothetical protein